MTSLTLAPLKKFTGLNVGIECLLLCNHYKDDGRGHVQYHDLEGYPICVDKS
jgi:hypothetical protein